MTKFSKTSLALAITGFAAASQAQTVHQLEELVVSASGVEQKITDAPASITVIRKEELDKKPYATLLDAVREVEGVDVGETTDKTGQGGISIRGMGADYTLILIDGKRQNNIGDIYPNNFGGNQFNHIPPKEMIERIEIIRGPASTLYGADALGGVINIITKKVSDTWTGSLSHSRTFESDDDFGNDDTTEFTVAGPLIENRLGLALRGSLYNRDASNPQYDPGIDPNGNQVPRELGFGGGGRTVDNENTNLGARLDYQVTDNQSLTFDYETSNQTYDNKPQDGDNPLGTTDSIDRLPRAGYALEQEFKRQQASIRHQGEWGFANSDIYLHHIETSNDGRTLPLTAVERLQYEQIKNSATDAEIEATFLPRPKRVLETRQTTLNLKFDSLVGDHLLVYGGEYIDAEMEDGTFGMTGARFSDGKTQPHRQWAVFVEDNWEVTRAFTLTGGVRYDHHNIFDGNVSPRLYGNWDITPEWSLKGGVSTGYKAPKASDLYEGITGFGGQGTRPFVGTPDLEPETSVNSELAVYYRHPEGHNANLTVFSNQFKDKIESGGSILHCDDANANPANCVNLAPEWNQLLGDGYEFGQEVNVDKAEINGVEIAGRYWILDTLSVRANYTYTDAEIKSGDNRGQPLAGTAKHMANATLDWQVTPQFNTYLTTEFRSKRYTSTPRGWNDSVDYPEFYKDYTILHLGAQYTVTDNLAISARVNNLLDEDFTGYKTVYTTDDGGATYNANYIDDYNVKAKARNYWLSATLSF